MSRWFVGSSSMTRCGPDKVASPSISRAFSPPESCPAGVSAIAAEKPMAPARPRTLASGASGISRRRVRVRTLVAVEFVELMLGEITDVELLCARDGAGHRFELAGEELHQRGLAVAVCSQQGNAVVVVDAQRQLAQHRAAGLVAHRHAIDRDDRRRQQLLGRRKRDRPHLVVDDRGRRFELGQQLQRDCAWRALVALARKRSTNACRCLRCASCFLANFASSNWRSRRVRSNAL